jgi:hypothetical protein
MKNSISEVFRAERTTVKTAFLSYYISMYNTVNKEFGYPDAPVSVDEIYDFIQDLKLEVGMRIPEITKGDISYCFSLLQAYGVCRT